MTNNESYKYSLALPPSVESSKLIDKLCVPLMASPSLAGSKMRNLPLPSSGEALSTENIDG